MQPITYYYDSQATKEIAYVAGDRLEKLDSIGLWVVIQSCSTYRLASKMGVLHPEKHAFSKVFEMRPRWLDDEDDYHTTCVFDVLETLQGDELIKTVEALVQYAAEVARDLQASFDRYEAIG